MKDFAAIAQKTYAQRAAQLAALRPVLNQARAAQEELRGAQEGAKTIRKDMETMKTLRNLPGFFPTPPAVVARMLEIVGDISGKTVLEPSAGKGNIAEAIRRANGNLMCVECNFTLCQMLRAAGFECIHDDFLNVIGLPGHAPGGFDFVLMNPPFERRQDVAHIKHAFEILKPGGTLVSVAGSVSAISLGEWACSHGGYVEPLPAGSFQCSERPTGVSCSLVIAEK